MKCIVQILLLCVVISCSRIGCSAEGMIVRIQAEPDSPLVGQKVRLTIDVLAQDGWAYLESFPLLELPGAYLHRYETQGTRINENLHGSNYSGQRYEILLFPHKIGELLVKSLFVEVFVKTWGTEAMTRSEKLSTEPVALLVSPPEGISPGDSLPVTVKLEAKQTWSSQEKKYQVGDAIEREVTRKATDVSAMVFEPLELSNSHGASCYPSQPEVNDSFNRGILEGTRVDKVSCVLEQQGDYTFPDIVVSFWNISTNQVDDLLLSGRTISVKGASGVQTSISRTSATEGTSRSWLFITAGTTVFFFLLWFFTRRQSAFIEKWRNKRKNSEKYLFGQVSKALKTGNKYVALAAIMRWLDHLPETTQPTRFDEFVIRYGDEAMNVTVEDLNAQTTWTNKQCRTLEEVLKQARKKYYHNKQGKKEESKLLPFVGLLPYSEKTSMKNR